MSIDKFDDLWSENPFSLDSSAKQRIFSIRLHELFKVHYTNCKAYRKIMDGLSFKSTLQTLPADYPFLPVRLFKEFDLASIPETETFKTMTSSGTTGQKVSKIYLDKPSAMLQMKTLTKITSHFIGPRRLPMLIIDSKNAVSSRSSFSARGAGILGFSILGMDHTYALDEKMQIDFTAVDSFLRKHSDKDILIFGFTSIIWEHFHDELKKHGRTLEIDRGILIHGGGWKKLLSRSVTNEVFKSSLADVCKVTKIYNYYGMVEQTGSIFVEGKCGYLHCSNFSDVIVRRDDFTVCEHGEKGLIELISLLPTSYPGHVILSEDIGEILGEDDCQCGLKGKYFRVHGRVANAEIRGCSDAYQAPS